jgi:restriction system protein
MGRDPPSLRASAVAFGSYGGTRRRDRYGKPLVLLNGASLLNLLEKHGHKAKIDLKEAKRILSEQA